jgi:hypothetical protein
VSDTQFARSGSARRSQRQPMGAGCICCGHENRRSCIHHAWRPEKFAPSVSKTVPSNAL